MSPQRRKGRGGGGGKTMAPLPSSTSSSAPPSDSPHILPQSSSKPAPDRRNLRDLLGVSHKPCLSPMASHLQQKLKPKDKGDSRRSSSVSCRGVAASNASVSSNGASRRADGKARAESRPRRNSSPKLSRCNSGSGGVREAEKIATIKSAVGSGRIKATYTKDEGKKISRSASNGSRADVVSVVKAPLSHKEQSRSCRSSSQKENVATEGLRWSTNALPVQNAKGKAGSEGSLVKLGLHHPSQHDVHPDGRLSTGTYAMSLPVNMKPGYGNNVQSTKPRDAIQHSVVVAFDSSQEATLCAPSSRVDVAHNGRQAPDGLNSFSSSLHRRLALLEGKVSQIAAELKKTKEMLDTNQPTGSAALLTDIQCKILSIERAMASRLSDTGASSPEDAIMEDQFLSSQSRGSSGSSSDFRVNPIASTEQNLQVTTTGSTRFASERGQFANALTIDGSTSAPARVARISYDQQVLEDRLFPHRKLLKSRIELHDRVVESRATLHESLSQGHIDDFESVSLGDTEDERSVMSLTCSEQLPCVDDVGMQMMSNDAVNRSAGTVEGSGLPNYHCNSTDSGKAAEQTCPQSGQNFQHLAASVQQSVGLGGTNVVKSASLTVSCSDCASGSEEISTQKLDSMDQTKNLLECDETLPSSFYEDQENFGPVEEVEIEYDDSPAGQLHLLSSRIATAGWYVCEGDAIVLAHDDGCCSYFDAANMEEKAVYEAPYGVTALSWNDCWLIRAAGTDGRSNKYIVAASAGSALDCGFCSWDFNSRTLAAYHNEYQGSFSKPTGLPQTMYSLRNHVSPFESLTHLPSSVAGQGFGAPECLGDTGISVGLQHHTSPAASYQGNCCESPQWWYRPCGPLMAAAGSFIKNVALYDIRDGDMVLHWDTNRPIAALDYCSPLQWRNRGKLVLAEEQAISVWDVNTMDVKCLQYVELAGKQITAFLMHNADAECSGGVRQRLSSLENEAYDGLCCTQNDINILDFRVPGGVAMSFAAPGQDLHSVFARGDMILTGGLRCPSNACQVNQWSIRRAGPVCTYDFPASTHHYTHLVLTQVWGTSDMVMAVNGNGLYIFQGYKEAEVGPCHAEEVKDVIGTQDLFNPSFDYSNFRVLLISRDRPASWCYWPH